MMKQDFIFGILYVVGILCYLLSSADSEVWRQLCADVNKCRVLLMII